ncbi:MAG: hypothetical protein J6I49_03930 [Bacteroidales bacterium]|nr:hypothetical protein [Bacteroidales bacterium]
MRATLATWRGEWRLHRYNRGSQIKYYNFWTDQRPEEMWFSRFILKHFDNIPKGIRLNFTSILGAPSIINDRRPGHNIFYTGENIHADRFTAQRRCYESQRYDLSIGFDTESDSHYMRLPLWVMWHFAPEATLDDIRAQVEAMRHPTVGDRPRFCALVSSHDNGGLRGEIMDALAPLGQVDSAGRFRHNTDDLRLRCNDDKPRFLRQYRYNICPENSDSPGYVTEKLFDALLSGCLPIYSGSAGHPEPDVLNPECILQWTPGADNQPLLDKIKHLEQHPDEYRRLAAKPRLLEGAEERIWKYYTDLHNHLQALLQ